MLGYFAVGHCRDALQLGAAGRPGNFRLFAKVLALGSSAQISLGADQSGPWRSKLPGSSQLPLDASLV